MAPKLTFHAVDPNVLTVMAQRHETVVFLDTAKPGRSNRYSFLFAGAKEELTAFSIDEIKGKLAILDEWARNSWVCGYLAYEAGYAFEDRLAGLGRMVRPGRSKARSLPLLWFGLFDRPWVYDHRTGQWDPPLPVGVSSPRAPRMPASPATKRSIRHLISRADFGRRIGSIKRWIGRGHTYQANFTYDVRLECSLPPTDLYLAIRRSQETPHCAFVQHRFGHVASFSPELFFRLDKGKVTVKPMKGTAPRGRFSAEDIENVNWLAHDPKNRAENVMIVDLLRNDLGRICEPGSVVTRSLFDVETHPTVHQMTSGVEGKLSPGINLSHVLRSIFPSGSVTGAPKIRTMEIIHDLERGRRGVYCGAVGYMSPFGKASFSVPIRTLQRPRGVRSWQYRVGSGIVWDSTADGEWRECAVKCRFLVHDPPEFELLESILFDGRFRLAAHHVNRMVLSARYFQIPFTAACMRVLMRAISAELAGTGPRKVRILLDKKGTLRWEHAPLTRGTVTSTRLLLNSRPVDESNPLLFHKTTHRPWFSRAAEMIARGNCYDVAFTNSHGEVTEGSRTSIFVRREGTLYTPPVSCGLLPGILRESLIARGRCRERILSVADLYSADSVYCGNSVRGLVRVALPPPQEVS